MDCCKTQLTASWIIYYPGKGAAYGRADLELREFTQGINIPVLPTPMGKGVVPDDCSLVISAARSKALGEFYLKFTVFCSLKFFSP